MKSILNDIELDFVELKYFLEYVEKNPNDKKLQEVASRALNNLAQRVDNLKKTFEVDVLKMDNENQRMVPPALPPFSKDVEEIVPPLPPIVKGEVSHQSVTKVEEFKEVVEKESPTTVDIQLENDESSSVMENSNIDVVSFDSNDTIDIVAEEDKASVVSENADCLLDKPRQPGELYKSLTLNDVFYYTRELFKNDSFAFKEGVRQLESLKTYQEARSYAIKNLGLDSKVEAFESFDEFLKRNFKAE